MSKLKLLDMLKRIIISYGLPYLKKSKRITSPIKIWRFGENNTDEIIYFITDLSSSGSGIYSIYLSLLSEISFAEIMGWIPIVDDSKMLFRRSKVPNKKGDNVMVKFFDFQNSLPVSEVLQSRRVVINTLTNKGQLYTSINKHKWSTRTQHSVFNMDTNVLEYWKQFAKTHLLYKETIKKELDELCKEVLYNCKDVLGVAVREGKMGMTKSGREESGEEKQPDLQTIIIKTLECIDKWGCRSIYISCETEKVIDIFKQEIKGVKIVYLDRERFSEIVFNIPSMKKGLKKLDQIYESINVDKLDYDYIKDMYILSNCDYLLASINCGTEVAYLQSTSYKNKLII